MDGPTSDKLLKLFEMLKRQPTDTFLLYGVGMEYKKLNDSARAVEYFDKVLAIDSGYCYAYYQRGQVLEEAGETQKAKQAYADGIAAAQRVGDEHAKSELQTALNMLD